MDDAHYLEEIELNKQKLINNFTKLPKDLTDQNYLISSLAINSSKNNFNNVLVSDSTRVKLQNYSHDYINANYILKNRYIATQQPNDNTILDFWRMVIETKSKLIVNLNGSPGSNNYLSLTEKQSNEILLDIKEIKSTDCIKIKIITIIDKRSCNINATDLNQMYHMYRIYHLTYLKWPDFGVPNSNEFIELINITKKINSLVTKFPIIVHCRAGIGRTGTFIMVHCVLNLLDHNLYPNLINFVKHMRYARSGMIQEVSQFEFILNIIQYKLKCKLKCKLIKSI